MDVGTTTVRSGEREEPPSGTTRPPGSLYRRNGREMRDLLCRARLCLPLWSSLPPEGMKEAAGVPDAFSWLVHGCYPQALPEQPRTIVAAESRKEFFEKKGRLMEAADGLLRRCEALRAT